VSHDDAITIDVPDEKDWPEMFAGISLAFNEDPDDAVLDIERAVVEFPRCLVARRGGAIVGTAGVYTRQLAVPGGVVPTGHVTLVTVNPTARRRGVLTRFMHRQLADIRAAGEPIAALWASEGRIYQRFGYGLGARRQSLTVDMREARLRDDAPAGGTLRLAPPADVRDAIVKVYDAAYATRPGWSERGAAHWDGRLADPEAHRRGSSKMRAVVHEGDHGVDGYALWRTESKWDSNGPGGEVSVVELVANNPSAYAGLWRFLLTLDLARAVSYWHGAIDEPLQYLVNEPRRLGAKLGDALWLRVIDVPAALRARRYAAPADLVLDVTDAVLSDNAGRWRLSVTTEAATCVRTTDPADLSLDVSALAATYLGDASFAALAAGGRVREHTPGALARATAAFGWAVAPSAIEIF
jgi:predicted acetyltransferase